MMKTPCMPGGFEAGAAATGSGAAVDLRKKSGAVETSD
jgi:hypothetical protein